jgi:zinc transport system substrate-binding protein
MRRAPVPAALSAALGAALVLSACGGDATADAADDGGRLQVAAGFYPYEFLAQRVGGQDVAVTNLTEPGGEPHDLELTPRQVGALASTDLVVFSAGFQPAVDEAVEQQAGDRAFDVLSAVELRDADEGGHEGGHEGEEHEGEGEAADPHVWLDPQRLSTIGTALADRLVELDPDGAAGYRARAQELRTELTALDDELRAGLETCERRQIVTSHDAFGYLADAYGLEQVAVAGLSPEDEASTQRLAEVASQAERDGVTTIFFEELVSPRVAESLAREVGATATVLTPLEGAPETGDYVSAMRENLATLRTALGCT